jgi:hypothetical protein
VLDSYPVIDVKRSGSLQGVIDALNRLVDIAVPEYARWAGRASSQAQAHLQRIDVDDARRDHDHPRPHRAAGGG